TGAGGKHCLYMAFMAVLNPGDEVIIPTPYWVSYPEQVKLAGGVPEYIAGEEKNGFKITPKQLEAAITPKTKVFLINSLSNPGGPETIEQMRKQFEKRGKHMWERLAALPKVTCVRPAGAFYCFPNIGAYIGKKAGGVEITDAVSFSAALLEQNHVAVVPG